MANNAPSLELVNEILKSPVTSEARLAFLDGNCLTGTWFTFTRPWVVKLWLSLWIMQRTETTLKQSRSRSTRSTRCKSTQTERLVITLVCYSKQTTNRSTSSTDRLGAGWSYRTLTPPANIDLKEGMWICHCFRCRWSHAHTAVLCVNVIGLMWELELCRLVHTIVRTVELVKLEFTTTCMIETTLRSGVSLRSTDNGPLPAGKGSYARRWVAWAKPGPGVQLPCDSTNATKKD